MHLSTVLPKYVKMNLISGLKVSCMRLAMLLQKFVLKKEINLLISNSYYNLNYF